MHCQKRLNMSVFFIILVAVRLLQVALFCLYAANPVRLWAFVTFLVVSELLIAADLLMFVAFQSGNKEIERNSP